MPKLKLRSLPVGFVGWQGGDMPPVVKRKLSSGHLVWLAKIDRHHGRIEFQDGLKFPFNPPWSYQYIHGGKDYREACDLYRQIFWGGKKP